MKHRHLHDVGEAAAGALHDLVDLREHLLHLRLEIIGDVAVVVVARRGLPPRPRRFCRVRDDAGRERPRQLERSFSMYSAADAATGSAMAAASRAFRIVGFMVLPGSS